MMLKPDFKAIDLHTWPRARYYEHYLHVVKCSYSIVADIDITALLQSCKQHNVKLYPAMIYIITMAVNQVEAMRTCFDENGKLGVWSYMSPCYTYFQDDDKTFTNIWTAFDDDFEKFHAEYLVDTAKYGMIKEFMAKSDVPVNTFPVSCIPWVDFNSFNLNIGDDQPYLCPIFTIGKYHKQDGRVLIPLAAQVHHATCDGYHVGLFYEAVKALACAAEGWLPAASC